MTIGLTGALAVGLAAALDWLIGDPRWMLHPVQVMGWLIQRLRRLVEAWCRDSPLKLRLGGLLITLLLMGGSGLAGWWIERLALIGSGFAGLGWSLLLLGLASALAGRSLHKSVMEVIHVLPTGESGDLNPARQKLSWIVGRDVRELDASGIVRAAAESASENAVDGLFAPLFWMGVGTWLWTVGPGWPGPLTLAWMFKASSTLDSMLGYREDALRWLGTAGARADDWLTWLPCRLVMLSLPLVSCGWNRWSRLVRAAESDGRKDPSPNAGRSEAIYAHCIGIRLGGQNRYNHQWREKPVLASFSPAPDAAAVKRILKATLKLELLWVSGLVLLQLAQ